MSTATLSPVQQLFEKAESFDDSRVFERFKSELEQKFGVKDSQQALELRKEALCYLAMAAHERQQRRRLPMFNKMIDEYWHTFILFTKEYFAFCQTLGVSYIHHAPRDKSQPQAKRMTRSEFGAIYRNHFGRDLPSLWGDSKAADCADYCGDGCACD